MITVTFDNMNGRNIHNNNNKNNIYRNNNLHKNNNKNIYNNNRANKSDIEYSYSNESSYWWEDLKRCNAIGYRVTSLNKHFRYFEKFGSIDCYYITFNYITFQDR